MEYKDYYKILELDKNAGSAEIKKAYRKLARKYHPDLKPNDKVSEEKFKDINEAYEVLSDPEKRKMYNQFGSQWQRHQQADMPNDFWTQWASTGSRPRKTTINNEDFEQFFSQGGSGFSDFFEALFGKQGATKQGRTYRYQTQTTRRRRRGREQDRESGRDSEHTVQISLREAFTGTRRVLRWQDGRKIEAQIPPGVKTGSRIRLRGQGESDLSGIPGDLYLNVQVYNDAQFDRDGDHLKITIPVDLYTALLGGQVPVTTLDKTVKLTIPPDTPNGKVFRLRGLGMPKLHQADQRGDLYARVTVQLPTPLNQSEKELFEQLRTMQKK